VKSLTLGRRDDELLAFEVADLAPALKGALARHAVWAREAPRHVPAREGIAFEVDDLRAAMAEALRRLVATQVRAGLNALRGRVD
jgi:hypothetical protein